MRRESRSSKRVTTLALAVVAGGAVACSHVGQDEFDTTIAQVRREVRVGDEGLSRNLGGRVAGLEGRVVAMERDFQALSADFDVMVERMDMAMRLKTPIIFGFDEATLQDRYLQLLDRVSNIVHDYYPAALITVEGFTDTAGSPAYNMQLGQRRAEAVKDYLVTNGQIPPDQVRAVSYGEDPQRLVHPDYTGPGDTGWQNRRVVLVVDYDSDGLGGQVAQSPQL
jgi:peptidoglycan-associated lipoprotein